MTFSSPMIELDNSGCNPSYTPMFNDHIDDGTIVIVTVAVDK